MKLWGFFFTLAMVVGTSSIGVAMEDMDGFYKPQSKGKMQLRNGYVLYPDGELMKQKGTRQKLSKRNFAQNVAFREKRESEFLHIRRTQKKPPIEEKKTRNGSFVSMSKPLQPFVKGSHRKSNQQPAVVVNQEKNLDKRSARPLKQQNQPLTYMLGSKDRSISVNHLTRLQRRDSLELYAPMIMVRPSRQKQ